MVLNANLKNNFSICNRIFKEYLPSNSLKRKYILMAPPHIEYRGVEICLMKKVRNEVNRKTRTGKEMTTVLHPKRTEDNNSNE
jgi:hypothetical protein